MRTRTAAIQVNASLPEERSTTMIDRSCQSGEGMCRLRYQISKAHYNHTSGHPIAE